MSHRQFPRGRESGAALIVALIFLLLMTLLSTSSMRTSTMQERMAGNLRDWNLGFQSAEASLREAEEYLQETPNLPEFNDTNGLYQLESAARPDWTADPLSAEHGGVRTVELVGVPDAQYYIEKLAPVVSGGELGPIEDIYYYRITAVGYGAAVDDGGAPLTAVVLQSVYRSR